MYTRHKCVCVCVLQRHKNYCCQARQALSQSVINYFIECSLVFYPQSQSRSQSLETASTTRLGYESTRIVCAPPRPSLSLPFVFSSVISGPRVAKFWKFFVAQNWTAQEGLLLLLLLRLLPCGSRNSCEIKLNATPIIPRNLSFSHSWSRASGVRHVLSTPPPKLRNHQKFKRNTQFPRSISPSLLLL